jgi:hypothetical protein
MEDDLGEKERASQSGAPQPQVRISRMSAHGFTACQANISLDVGPRFHGMPVQDDAGGWIVSESSFGVNDWRC